MLAGTFDDERGWGVAGETWTVIDALAEYGEETWFRLGDHDFATHIARGARLRAGATLTEAVLDLQRARGVPTPILPMTDAAGPHPGPHRRRLARLPGLLRPAAPGARRPRGALRRASTPRGRPRRSPSRIQTADVIVIGPSNPIVSIGPILAVPGHRASCWRPPARAASRSSRSARSSAARRSRARPTGCSRRSATGRAPRRWRRCCDRRSTRSCSIRRMPRSSRRSRRSGCARSRPTPSWPTTPGAPGWPRAVLEFAVSR